MRTTRPSTLVVAALAAAALAWLGIDRFYGAIPRLPWLPPLSVLALAVAEWFAAWQTRSWLERRPGARLVEPLLIVRYVVLAKASALAGAIFSGCYLGLGIWLFVQRTVLGAAHRDLYAAIAGFIGSIALVIAATILERACRVPRAPNGTDQNGKGGGPGGNGGYSG